MRRLVLFAFASAAVAVIVWWFSQRPAVQPVPQATTSASTVAPAAPTPTALLLSAAPSYEVPPGGAYEGLNDPRWQWWNAMKKVDRSFEWKIPINFDGRVVDENGKAVAGASVRFGWTDTSAQGSSEIVTPSDANGRFALSGKSGKRLHVRIAKDGYHTAGGKGGESFEYAAFFESNFHQPDPNEPVTFRLIKKIDPEPLIRRHASERLTYDASGYYDLERGALALQPPSGAALKFTFERSQSAQGQPFDWRWIVEAVDAALLETKDEFAQVAPEGGYMSTWEIAQAANAQPFEHSAQARFFVRTSDNRFARIDVEVAHPNARHVGPRITVDSFLNPSGSRNLDYDPSGN